MPDGQEIVKSQRVVREQSQGQSAPMSTILAVETITAKETLRMGHLEQWIRVFGCKTCSSNVMHSRYSEKDSSTKVYKC